MGSPSVAFKEFAELSQIGRALDCAANPVALLDRGARIVWSNKAYTSCVEDWRPPGASKGSPQISANVSLVCQRLQTAMGPGYRDLWSSLAAGEVWSGEVALDAPDAPDTQVSTPIFDCILSPLPDSKGRCAYFLLILHDVTTHHHEKKQHAHAAKHDALTGLGNRLRMTEVLAGLIARKEEFSVFYLDLDGFKGVNDTFGHAAGDEVLKAFARHLRYVCRGADTPLRLGGDEFVVILPGDGAESDLHMIADRLLTTANMAFSAVSAEIAARVGVSIGGARYPLDGETQEAILDMADKALYQAKHAGKGCFVLGGLADAA